jgi:hypothetical protein
MNESGELNAVQQIIGRHEILSLEARLLHGGWSKAGEPA